MARRTVVDPRFAARLRELLDVRRLSFRAVAARTYYSKSYIHDVATGRKAPTLDLARRLDEVIGAGADLASMVDVQHVLAGDDELEALELGRMVAASDVADETLDRLEQATDDLATAYAATPPAELLNQVKRHLGYLSTIMEARKTLRQQRRLVTVGGWLSLLAATIHIDLRQSGPAEARLRTASAMAQHAEHAEIEAWCIETRAWNVLTDGDYRQAIDLSRHSQAVAPSGSSAHIQATAQEGRAWARLRQRDETRAVLDRVDRLTSSLPVPDRPEHHFRYDPDKALSYTATTLAWAGDPAAEQYARSLIGQLEGPGNGVPRPRRVASARLDLALALLGSGRPDEAVAEASAAIASGRVVASNWWRATEVLANVEQLDVPEAAELRDLYEEHRPRV